MSGSSRLLHQYLHHCPISWRPSFQRQKAHGTDPHTPSDIHPCLGESPFIPAIDVTAPSSLSATAPKLQYPPDVCLRSSLLAFSSVTLAASAANLYPCMVVLLSCCTISFFLILCSIPKKMSKVPSVYLLTYFCSVHHAEPFKRVLLTAFGVAFAFHSFSSIIDTSICPL